MGEAVLAEFKEDKVTVGEGAKIKTFAPRYPSAGDYLGIFLTSAGVLLFELVLVRIFAVMLWAHLAFMVVGTALFGFGLSGVYLALRKRDERLNLSVLCLCGSLGMLAAYLVVRLVPFRMWDMGENGVNLFYLATWYVSLILPFFFAGLTVAELLRTYPVRANRLYGLDLLGAGLGSLLIVPVIMNFAGEGTVVFSALLLSGASFAFAAGQSPLRQGFMALLVLLLARLVPLGAGIAPVKLHQTKRRFNEAVEKNKILATRWSPISRVDVARHKPYRPKTPRKMRAIWIDGGTNESIMLHWNGDLKRLKPLSWSSIGTVYALRGKADPKVMIIGSSGGREALFALSHGVRRIDALEMDPSIVKFLHEPRQVKFMGGLFEDKGVNLINDEGRSFLRRQPLESYDIIQSVNNYTPVAIASGALNISENFLFTEEAFLDFYDHLKPGGVLALHRGEVLRIALMAASALYKRGIEHPEKQMIVTNGERGFFYGFFLKKGPWTKAEEKRISDYLGKLHREGGFTFQWTPFKQKIRTIYSKILSLPVPEQKMYYKSLGVNLTPPTDDRPFLGHYLKYGNVKLSRELPAEFIVQNQKKVFGIIPRGDFPYLVILAESALLALLFIGVPLFTRAKNAMRVKGFVSVLGYFAALGFGFIVVEVCLMQRFVLFLGAPAYSIAAIFVSLLLGSGFGSIASERVFPRNSRRGIVAAVCSIALVLLLEALLLPSLFELFLRYSFYGRLFVTFMALVPVGFVMGMAFPLGLRFINTIDLSDKERRQMTAWMWGINGYTTVIGSAAAVFITLLAGFRAALLSAGLAYLAGMALICRVKFNCKKSLN